MEKFGERDRELRLKILEYLKGVYDDNIHMQVSEEDLRNGLSAQEKELRRNIKYLDEKEAIDVTWFLGGSFIASINSYGIDILEETHSDPEEDKDPFEGKIEQYNYVYPEKVMGSLIHEIKEETDEKLKKISPDIIIKLEQIYKDIGVGTEDEKDYHKYSLIAFTCREILKDFTDSIYKDDYLQPGEVKPTREQIKVKLRYTLRNNEGSTTKKNKILELSGYLVNYFEELSNYLQKNTHPVGVNKPNYTDARSCIIYTYLIIHDIINYLDL